MRWLKGLRPMRIVDIVDVRTGAHVGVQVTARGQTRRILFRPPSLPAAYSRLLDFDALAREAQLSRQEAQEPPRGSPRTVDVRTILKPDVTRTEELLLTTELLRRDEWCVENPEAQRIDGQERGGEFLCLRPESSGLIEVYSFSCGDYTTDSGERSERSSDIRTDKGGSGDETLAH